MKTPVTQEDIDKQLKLIGEFFVQYDHAISVIPFIIPKLIFGQSLNPQNQRNIETLLSDLATESLRAKFDSLLADNHKDIPKLIGLNSRLSNAVVSITQIRNSFAHGSYRLGWEDFDSSLNAATFSLKHSKATKKGFQKRSRIYDIKELENLIFQLRVINTCYIKIAAILDLQFYKQDISSHLIFLEIELDKIGQIKLPHLKELN